MNILKNIFLLFLVLIATVTHSNYSSSTDIYRLEPKNWYITVENNVSHCNLTLITSQDQTDNLSVDLIRLPDQEDRLLVFYKGALQHTYSWPDNTFRPALLCDQTPSILREARAKNNKSPVFLDLPDLMMAWHARLNAPTGSETAPDIKTLKVKGTKTGASLRRKGLMLFQDVDRDIFYQSEMHWEHSKPSVFSDIKQNRIDCYEFLSSKNIFDKESWKEHLKTAHPDKTGDNQEAIMINQCWQEVEKAGQTARTNDKASLYLVPVDEISWPNLLEQIHSGLSRIIRALKIPAFTQLFVQAHARKAIRQRAL